MIRLLLLSTLLIGTLVSDTTITLKKGWQFIGFPSNIEDTNAFNNTNVDIVWGFDATTQKWLGFSPSQEKTAKITKKYEALTNIQAWQGVWIHNNNDWTLSLKKGASEDANITLSQGWNLISLPSDMSVSPTIFKDDTVWKYSDEKWKIFTQNESEKDIAPPISKINSAEALWVKSENRHLISLSQDSSALHTFADKKKMQEYIKEMLLESRKPRFYDYQSVTFAQEKGAVLDSPTADAAANATDATGTNLQEDDVDESDILKHDGNHTFFYNRAKNIIHITNFSNLASQTISTIPSINLPQNRFLEAMFIKDKKLIMITNEQRYYYAQDRGIAVDDFLPNKTQEYSFDVRIYNIEDINNIKELSTTTIDGSYQNSRIVQDKLYLISQFTPSVTIEYPKIYITNKCQSSYDTMPVFYEDGRYINECGNVYFDSDSRAYRYDYSKPSIKDMYLIPTINKGEKDLITHDTFYAPYKLNQFPTITAISKFDLTTNSFEKSVSTAGHTNKLYASSKNIYLTSTHYPYYYDFRDYHEREMIYKFSIGEDFDYKAKGFVDGSMLNQFSMSEKDDVLRVATTSGQGWRGETTNSLFTLKENGTNLEIVGSLTGLGKERERIKAVRFLGDRGYVVTFEQTDPFYTLDMSDANNPKKVGELQIEGFSSYIHPVDENLILTLGRNAVEGRQAEFIVQLFDISDFANPIQADIRHYSSSAYSFDAEYNSQAFIYRRSDKLFGITYHDREVSMMDVLQVNTTTRKIDPKDTLSLTPSSYENRGILFSQGSNTYGTLFSGDFVNSKIIGAVQ